MNDGELLKAVTTARSREAFARIVARYTDLVYSAASRQVGSGSLAEDVTQAVFLMLWQRASSVRGGSALAGWLVKTARFASLAANRAERRRKNREQSAAFMNTQTINDTDDPQWKQIAPLLDEALSRLGTEDRTALSLRYLQGKSLAEVAATMGLSETAATKRVSRAAEKVRKDFHRRGIVMPTAALTALLLKHALIKAPPALAEDIAVAETAAAVTTIAAAAGSLMLMQKVIAVAVAAVIVLVLGGGTWLAVEYWPSDSKNISTSAAPAQQLAPATRPAQPRNTMDLLVVDRVTGKPIAGLNIITAGGAMARLRTVTPADGRVFVPLPTATNYNYFNIAVRGPGFVYKRLLYLPSSQDIAGPPPASYTIPMDRSATIRGRVIDDAGQPVVDANVMLDFDDTFSDPHEMLDIGGQLGYSLIKTNADGVFTFNNAPQSCEETVVAVWDYHHALDENSILQANEMPEKLLNGSMVFTLRRGALIDGTVLDPQGKPLAGANVYARVPVGSNRFRQLPPQVTGADGKFLLTFKPGDEVRFSVEAQGYADQDQQLIMGQETLPMKITMSQQ